MEVQIKGAIFEMNKGQYIVKYLKNVPSALQNKNI